MKLKLKINFKLYKSRSFTLIELMAVVAVIAILAGLVLGGAGAVRQRAARGQAKAEVAAIEAGLARYQMDFGQYPVAVGALSSGAYAVNPGNYVTPGQTLFTNLWGTNKFTNAAAGRRQYLSVRPSMVFTSGASANTPDYFIDPWGYAYGYYWSGSNSLYGGAVPDVWSTGGQSGANAAQRNTNKWVTSWQ